MRTATVLMTVLLLGASTGAGRRRPAPRPARPRSSAPRHRRRTPPAPSRARSWFASAATHRTSIARPWRRRCDWAATRDSSRRFGTRPRSGSSCSATASRTAIRYAREKVEAGGRTIVLVTDRPVLFLGSARGRRPSRAPATKSPLSQIQVDGTGRGKGTMAAAARVRPDGERRRAARRLRRAPSKLVNVTRKPGAVNRRPGAVRETRRRSRR